jgi:hypothetical protein
MENTINKIDRTNLKQELNSETFVRKTNKGDNEIYVFDHRNAPNLLQEVGRLREVTFRAAGGSTGKSVDIDQLSVRGAVNCLGSISEPINFKKKSSTWGQILVKLEDSPYFKYVHFEGTGSMDQSLSVTYANSGFLTFQNCTFAPDNTQQCAIKFTGTSSIANNRYSTLNTIFGFPFQFEVCP